MRSALTLSHASKPLSGASRMSRKTSQCMIGAIELPQVPDLSIIELKIQMFSGRRKETAQERHQRHPIIALHNMALTPPLPLSIGPGSVQPGVCSIDRWNQATISPPTYSPIIFTPSSYQIRFECVLDLRPRMGCSGLNRVGYLLRRLAP